MKRKMFLLITLIAILGSALVLGGCGQTGNNTNGNADKKITVSIGKVPYPDMWPATYIIKDVAEELGYETKIVEADIGLVYQGLAQGDINVFPDVCLPIVHQSYMDKYAGKFEVVGTVYKNAPSGLTVPANVDIDSISELKGRADEFDGRIVGVEPSAGMMMQTEETIETYGLDEYELLEGSTPAMLAEVKKATKNNDPILFLSWRPHPMWLDYDLKILEDTKDLWPTYDAKTGVSNDFKEKAPDLYKFIQNFEISIPEIEEMLLQMENENKDMDALAKDWIAQNRTAVDDMLAK